MPSSNAISCTSRGITPIDYQAVHLGHPDQRALIQQAGHHSGSKQLVSMACVNTRLLALAVLWPTPNPAQRSAVVMKGPCGRIGQEVDLANHRIHFRLGLATRHHTQDQASRDR